MKIAFTGLDLVAGKVKYADVVFTDLAEKFQPAKRSPYYFELMQDDYNTAQAIAVSADHLLDVLIHDIEKIESRLTRTESAEERALLERMQAHLDEQKPVCDMPMNDAERALAVHFGPLSLKPTVVFASATPTVDDVCREVMSKAGWMFFYTAGKKEVHAWLVDRGADAVTCAGRIHSDLARGFIKADVVKFDDLMAVHNMQEARTKGLVELVDRGHVIPENAVIEIRFNV